MEEFQIQNIDSNQYISQNYKSDDTNLLSPININKEFGNVNDIIEFHIISPNGEVLESNYNYKNYKNKNVIDNSSLYNTIEISPEDDLLEYGYDKGQFDLLYNFNRLLFSSSINSNFFIKEISNDRTELKITTNNIDYLTLQSLYVEFIVNRNQRNFYSDFILNFGQNESIIGVNIALDNDNTSIPSLYIKLYEPLPSNYQIKSTFWLAEIISEPYSFRINGEVIVEGNSTVSQLRGPNFNIEINNQISTTTPYLNISNILSTDLTSSYNQLQSIIKDNIDINIDYNSFSNFIHFSSARERVNNFIYKLTQIQKLESDLNIITNLTSSIDSGSINNSILTLKNQINNITQNFDGYENFLFYESGSNSFPKLNSIRPYINDDVNSIQSITWLGSEDEASIYYGGIVLEASTYDYQNRDYIWNNLPEYIKYDPQNNKLELMVAMMGQHFDYIWTYIKDITNKNVADNRLKFGISKDLVADALRSFGIKLYTNSRNNENIYSSILGVNPDGTFLPYTGSYKIDNYITASNYTIPSNDIVKSTYKRVYHNLPYLLKSRGTEKGLRALINCFGIPETILDVKEFGGVIKELDLIEQNVEKFNYSLYLNSLNILTIPWRGLNQQYINTGFDNIVHDTIEFRFKNYPDPVSNFTQSLLEANNTGVLLTTTFVTGTLGDIKFILKNADNNTQLVSSSLRLPLYNGDWWNVNISRETGSIQIGNDSINNTYTLTIGNKDEYGIQNIYSSSIYINGSTSSSYNKTWNSTGSLLFGGGSVNNAFSGSLQEFRYWINSIPINNFTDHILNPKSFSQFNETSSYENLVFRLPLGSELDIISESRFYSVHPSNIETFISGGLSSSYAVNSNPSFIRYIPNYEQYLVNSPNGGSFIESNEKIKIIETETLPDNTLSPNVSIVKKQKYNQVKNSSKLEIAISPQNSINDDIIKQLGNFNLDEYIGDPRDANKLTYPKLDELRSFYFKKYLEKQDIFDIIKLLSYLDNSLFKMIKDYVPAKANLSSGLVIKPHILERNKVQKFEPVVESKYMETEIQTAFITGSNGLNSTIDSSNTKYYNTEIGIVAKVSTDNKELYNGELSDSEIEVYKLPSTNIVYELNKIKLENEEISKNYSKLIFDPILNNVEKARTSKKYFNVDYNGNINIPVNLNYITSSLFDNVNNEVINADIQESNYTLKRYTQPRYLGSKLISKEYNIYNIGDISYGKNPVINKNNNKFVYFEEMTSQSLTLPGRTNAYIKYLIDENSNITELTRQNKNLFDIQSIFNVNKADVLLDDNQNPSNQKILDGLKPIFAGGFRYETVLQNLSTTTSTHNSLEYTFLNDIPIQNISGSEVTSPLANEDLSINFLSLQSNPTITPGLNTLSNTLQSNLNSRILVNVTRNTLYPGQIIQKVTGSVSFITKVSPPTNLITRFYRNTNYTGVEYLLEPGVYNNFNNDPDFPGFNDNVRSIKVPAGIKADIYRHPNLDTLINSFTGPTQNPNIVNPLTNGVTSANLMVLSTSASFNISNKLNSFGNVPTSNIPEGNYPIESANNLEIIINFNIEGIIILPDGVNSGNIELRDINNNIGNIRATVNLTKTGVNNIQFTELPQSNQNAFARIGTPFIYTSPPDYIYITGSLDYGFNSGSAPINNWYFERGNSDTNGSNYNLLTGSFYLSDIIYNRILNEGNQFIQTSPLFSPLGYEEIETIFHLKVGDLVRFYNNDRRSFPINFENEIKAIHFPQSQPISSSYDNRLVIELTNSIPNQACLDYSESGSLAKNIQNFIMLSKISDETNLVLNTSKKPGATSSGIILPNNISDNVKNKAGNIIKQLKNQNLI